MWREDHSGNLVFLCECIPFQHVGAYVESLQHGEVMCSFLTFCTCLMDCTRFHSIRLLSLCRFDAIPRGRALHRFLIRLLSLCRFDAIPRGRASHSFTIRLLPLCRFDAIQNGLKFAEQRLKLRLHGDFIWIPLFVPIGEALNPGPHSFLRVNVINPTSLHGKVSEVLSLGEGIHCLSETSVTSKAAQLIRRECRKSHHFVQFSEMAQPKGMQGFNNDSLRGSNTGCAVISNFHVHRAFNHVDPKAWCSGRILGVLVPVNCHLTLRFLVVYLPAKSKDNPMRLHEANCIMNEVHKRIVMSEFPTLLVGDFNIEAELLETCNILFTQGWKDLAILSQLKWGFGAEATCRGATRRSFALGDSRVVRFLHDVRVIETYQFDSHPVLKVRLNVATAKYTQLVWPHPRSFDDHKFNDATLNDEGKKVAYDIADDIDLLLQEGQGEQALQLWSQQSEDCLFHASETVNSSHKQQYHGRCKVVTPTEISISPPCVRHGRPGDVDVHIDSANTRTRQLLKQTRRLKHLAGVIAKQGYGRDCDPERY